MTAKNALAILLISFIFQNSPTFAEALSKEGGAFFGKIAMGGYLGQVQPALGYNFSRNWDLAFGVGRTPALNEIIIYQINIETRYNLMGEIYDGKLLWRPLQVSGAFVWAMNNDFFVFSPSRYPERNYYEPTSIGFLLGLGTEMDVPILDRRYTLAMWFNIHDRYLVAKFNNLGWNSAYCCSGGVSIKTNFGK